MDGEVKATLDDVTLEGAAEIDEEFDREVARLAAAELAASGVPVPRAPTAAAFMPERKSGWQPQKMRFWYEAIADELIADPKATGTSIAKALGRAPETIRLIMSSDAFKAYWEQRRGLHNAILDAGIRARVGTATTLVLDEIIERMQSDKRALIPFDTMRDTAVDLLDRLYGPKNGGAAGSQVNVNVNAPTLQVSADELRAAQENLRRQQAAAAAEVIDVEPVVPALAAE